MKHKEPSRKLLWFWWLVFIVLLALVVLALLKVKDIDIKLPRNQPGLYSVSEFIDGDTIAVSMNGSTEVVRMIGIDTPETHRPNTPVQCYGPQAADYTKYLIGNNKVRLQADPLNTNRDRYERLLRYVYLPDNTLVQALIISEGYGFAYTQFPYLKAGEFEKLENQAEQAKKGLWAACKITVQPNGFEQTNTAR